MLHKKITYEGDIPRQEEIMQEIDIKRSTPDELQVLSYKSIFREEVLMLSEKSQDYHDTQCAIE